MAFTIIGQPRIAVVWSPLTGRRGKRQGLIGQLDHLVVRSAQQPNYVDHVKVGLGGRPWIIAIRILSQVLNSTTGASNIKTNQV